MADTKKLKRILSLDGGGIRGVMTAQILVALEDTLNERYKVKNGAARAKPIRLAEYFDMIAGTSTGGILTCILLVPSKDDPTYPRFSAREALDLYVNNGANIFKPTFSGRLPGFLNGIGGSKFGGLSMEKILESYLKDSRLTDMLKPCLITSYDIQMRRAVFFTSHDAAEDGKYNYFLKDVARSTSAAPTYFPPATARSADDLLLYTIDGGLFANNPSMCALIEGLKVFKKGAEMFSPEYMMILSIGTGIIKKPYSYAQAIKWGILRWVTPLIDIMMSSVSETVDYQLKKLFKTLNVPDNYYRIMPDLGYADSEMSNVSTQNIEALRQAGIMCAEENSDKLVKIADELLNNG